jgi:hypothetical protein
MSMKVLLKGVGFLKSSRTSETCMFLVLSGLLGGRLVSLTLQPGQALAGEGSTA